MEQTYYIEINVICILVLVIIVLSLTVKGHINNYKYFKLFLFSTILFCACDIAAKSFSGIETQWAFVGNNISNALYFIFTACTAYTAFMYFCERFKLKYNILQNILIGLPALVLAICSILSIPFGLVFNITDANLYERGSAYYIQVVISFGYLICGIIIGLIKFCRRERHNSKIDYFLIELMLSLPIIGGALQKFRIWIPITWSVNYFSCTCLIC